MQFSKIGLVGCGAMGAALARGLIARGGFNPAALAVFDIQEESMRNLAAGLSVYPAAGYADLCRRSELIFLAVKPQDVAAALTALKINFKSDNILVSLAAGISTAFLERFLEKGSKVIRLMPNTPCLIGEGAMALCAGGSSGQAEMAAVEELLKPLGLTVQVTEKQMAAVTGLSGSGPAYVYIFLEALIDGGVEAGLSRQVATSLAVQTVIGSARMMQKTDRHPAELKNEVTSPAGTTSAGLRALEEASFRGSIIKAVADAARRAEEFSRE